MRLRYQREQGTRGLILLESEPQLRSVFCYSQSKPVVRLAFPYVLSTICYTKMPTTNTYMFGGIYQLGLRIFLRNEPLQTLRDTVFFSPTDMERSGLVCTPHQNDNKHFKTVAELGNFVVGMWWSTHHNIQNLHLWQNLTLETTVKNDWQNAGPYPNALKHGLRYYGSGYEIDIPPDAEAIDEPWPKSEGMTLQVGNPVVE